MCPRLVRTVEENGSFDSSEQVEHGIIYDTFCSVPFGLNIRRQYSDKKDRIHDPLIKKQELQILKTTS